MVVVFIIFHDERSRVHSYTLVAGTDLGSIRRVEAKLVSWRLILMFGWRSTLALFVFIRMYSLLVSFHFIHYST